MKKKGIIILLAIISLISIPIMKLKADSGWDSGYDSGWSDSGSSWSSSDYDYDYDYDHDYDYNSGSHGESGPYDAFFLIITLIIIFAITIYSLKNAMKKGAQKALQEYENDKTKTIKKLTQEEINNIDSSINVEEIKKNTFDLYKNVQIAWMEFDYDKLREYLSDELYNNYKMQLETLKLKNGKNIMENITFHSADITDIRKTENLETITVMLTISMKDYVVDKNNAVIRGNKFATTTITYLITLERSLQKEVTTCPNCGANLENNASTTCPYCDSVIVKNTSKFIMTKKENIKQNWRQ